MTIPIIPSFYRKDAVNKHTSGHMQSMSDTSLRVGRILAAYDIAEGGNRNKRVPEYDVMVRHGDRDGMVTDVLYPRVRMANLFGGATDFFRWTPRIDNFDQQTQVGYGSRVLLLCVNGSQRNAFIIGGIPHPEDGAVELPYNNNHHLEFQFNGMYANIDKDGSFLLLHRGATDEKNAVANGTGGNSSLHFNANGDITLGYNFDVPKAGSTNPAITTNQDDLPYVKLIKNSNPQLEIYAKDDVYNKTGARYLIETKSGIKVNHNGSDQQAWLRASAYRDKQQTMHQNLMSQLTSLATALTTVAGSISAAAIALTTASVSLLPPMGGSTAASPSVATAALSLTSAGSTLSSAVSTVTQMGSEIQSFESSNGSYLSPSHFHSDNP